MKSPGGRKLILITRKTRLDDLVSRFNTEAQARFYIEQSGQDYLDYRNEHEQYYQSLRVTQEALSSLGRLQCIDRSFLTNFIFGRTDLVWVLGQDGLVANSLKYLTGQPLVGINPDPQRWDGILLPFIPHDLLNVGPEILAGKRKTRSVTMAQVRLNNGESLLAVNDLFIGPKSHTSARYIIQQGSKSEEQSSSGIIVSTGMGSTGWFKSLLTGAAGISSTFNHKSSEFKPTGKFTWESDYLYYTVREPFPSTTSKATLIFGKITLNNSLRLTSRMANNGVIFSDGIEKDYLEFNSGTEATISLAEAQGQLIC